MKSRKDKNVSDNEVVELTDDIEVIGPGQLLKAAREACGLSQLDVAQKLYFRLALVQDIENNKFDKSISATFNRGYLRNYAKLVKLSEQDVIASYEMLDIAEQNGSAMQSFSKNNKKEAENNRIMWLSYLILAIIAGSTVIWWYQENNLSELNSTSTAAPAIEQASPKSTSTQTPTLAEPNTETKEDSTDSEINTLVADTTEQAMESTLLNSDTAATTAVEELLLTTRSESELSTQVVQTHVPQAQALSNENNAVDYTVPVIFTFVGDCWVNIYDSTGEHIAWGVKKSGYEMHISGQPPFSITLGKPELVNINYAGQPVDMTQFAVGNIAKFTLPINDN